MKKVWPHQGLHTVTFPQIIKGDRPVWRQESVLSFSGGHWLACAIQHFGRSAHDGEHPRPRTSAPNSH